MKLIDLLKLKSPLIKKRFTRLFLNQSSLLEYVLTNGNFLNHSMMFYLRDNHVVQMNIIYVNFLSSHEYLLYFEILIHNPDNFHIHHHWVYWQ
jgi:hypothetical protein